MPAGTTSCRGVVDWQTARADQAHAHARLFEHFAERGVVGQLVVFDVAAGRQPLAELAVVVQQHAARVDDEDGDGEVAQHLPSARAGARASRAGQSILSRVAACT